MSHTPHRRRSESPSSRERPVAGISGHSEAQNRSEGREDVGVPRVHLHTDIRRFVERINRLSDALARLTHTRRKPSPRLSTIKTEYHRRHR
jgi:putative heme degradation protein